MRHRALIALVALSCSDPVASLRVEGGPVLVVAEGALVTAPVIVDPASVVASPQVVVDAALATLFELLEVAPGPTGQPALHVQATCSAVGEGEGPVAVPVRIVDGTGRAAEAAITVLVHATPAGETGACSPTVDAWLGAAPDCSDEPPAPGAARIVVPPVDTAQVLCLRVRPAPADHEPLWLITQSDASPKLLPTMPGASAFTGELRVVVPVGESLYFRGEFELAYFLSHADPAAGAIPFFTGSVVLVVGDPGDLAISVHTDPVAAIELDAVQIPFRTWRYDDPQDPGDDAVCVRAFREPAPGPRPREKPYARVYNAQGARSDGWLCAGDTFFARVSPAVDSAPAETLVLVACRCASPAACDASCVTPPLAECDGAVAQGETVACIDLPLDVASVADVLAPDPFDPVGPATLACADIQGDATPEVVRVGAIAALVDTGFAQRYAPAVGLPAPTSVLALRRAGGARAILGSFAEMRSLDLASSDWMVEPAIAPTDLTLAQAAGPITGEATHLVVPVAPGPFVSWSLSFRCLDAGCTPLDAEIPAAPPGSSEAGLGRVDLDGDGGDDLVLFTIEGGNAFAIPVLVDWLVPSATPQPPVDLGAPPSGATRVSAAAAGADLAFIWTGGVDPRVHFLGAASEPTIGPALALAAAGDRLVVATPFDVRERVPGAPATWRFADPLLEEDALDGVIAPPPPGYGALLTGCLDDPRIVFTLGTGELLVTQLGVTVAAP